MIMILNARIQIYLSKSFSLGMWRSLSKRSSSDRLIWTGTSNGNFSVRSAYHLLLHEQERMLESSSRGLGESQQLWTAIWSAKVQPKIRVFMWRACLDILPTRTKLFDRGILSSFSCQWCEEDPETSSHVLWQCDFAQRVWSACPVPIPHDCHPSLPFCDFISICIQCLSGSNLEILFSTAWEIWNARNRFFCDSKSITVVTIELSIGILSGTTHNNLLFLFFLHFSTLNIVFIHRLHILQESIFFFHLFFLRFIF